jgi:5-methylcytosine-specific restriction endonuclease McrA
VPPDGERAPAEGPSADPAEVARSPNDGDTRQGKFEREHVPVEVMRAVWKRDAGRCQWKIDGGGICGSTYRVELDHIVPVAKGGPTTVENCRLLCKSHQLVAARREFGDACMDRFVPRRATPPPGNARRRR